MDRVVFVTTQRARWGSYSPRTKTVRLSAALRRMPRWVLEAVMVHELAHVFHPDHSPAFWRLLRDVCSDTDRAEAFLTGVSWLADHYGDLPAVERKLLGELEERPKDKRSYGEAKKANFYPRDERQLVGGSDDVFFGRVVERTGSEKAPPIGDRQFREPQTQYAVKVTQAIKGGLSGTITVNRRGGSPGAPDAPGGGSLLEEGREHLFVSKYVEAKGWHQVLPGAGVVEVEDGAYRRELERKYEEAFVNQIKVNIPLSPATQEEVDEREYRPC